MTHDKEKLAQAMRAAREEADLSQDAVAQDIGITQRTLSLWETAKTQPKATQVASLFDYYSEKTGKHYSIDKALER